MSRECRRDGSSRPTTYARRSPMSRHEKAMTAGGRSILLTHQKAANDFFDLVIGNRRKCPVHVMRLRPVLLAYPFRTLTIVQDVFAAVAQVKVSIVADDRMSAEHSSLPQFQRAESTCDRHGPGMPQRAVEKLELACVVKWGGEKLELWTGYPQQGRSRARVREN